MASKSVIQIEKVEDSRLSEVSLEDPGFGQVFSDHMFEMKYRDGSWQTPQIKPFGTIEVTPALNVFHYGQSVFEGTKAYYAGGGEVNLFRPEKNIERMASSCRRICIPEIDPGLFMEAIEQLIKLDYRWIPQKEGNSLYIRPMACAFEPVIAAHSSNIFRFYIITSPVGAYYSKPVKLITAQQYARAVKGGVGEVKTAGNYAASMLPAVEARRMGYDQVLWLDALEHRYIEEVGTMNIFFLIDGRLITRELSGTILPGITRDSVIQLAKHWDVPVEERKISVEEVMEAGRQGSLQEVFGTGTATVIAPVSEISHNGESVVPEEAAGRGPLGRRLYEEIYGIQTGKRKDPFGWVHAVQLE